MLSLKTRNLSSELKKRVHVQVSRPNSLTFQQIHLKKITTLPSKENQNDNQK